MSISRIFATIALVYGATLAVATFAWKQPMLEVFRSEHATLITFLFAAVLFLPFVITFTKLGLNTGEGEEPSPEMKARLATLSSECRMWPVMWYGPIGFVVLSWVAFSVFGDAVHPFYAFSSAVSLVSGLWFAFVYPTAKRLFDRSSESG